MSERRIEYLRLDAIVPALRNPKRHQAADITASISRFGFTEPVVMDERTGRLVAGHGRLESLSTAQAEGGEPPDGIVVTEDGAWALPVVRGWASRSDSDAEGFLIASNRVGEAGGWDDEALADLLRDYSDDPDWLTGTGYSHVEFDALLADHAAPPEPLSDPDDVPEPPAEPITQPGDLWLLGDRHRVLCGDATDRTAYERVLNGERAALCLTDPPYGVGIDYGSGVTDDEASIGALIDAFVPLILTHAERSLVTSGHRLMWLYPRPSWLLAWVEPAGAGKSSWGFTCMFPVLAYGSDPYLAAGMGARPDTYFGQGEGPSDDRHPVAKPITVWSWLAQRGSVNAGDLILDPFGGSGTTVIAAHSTGRRAACIELSPAYVDVIAARFQAFTGIVPVLEATGDPHDFLMESATV